MDSSLFGIFPDTLTIEVMENGVPGTRNFYLVNNLYMPMDAELDHVIVMYENAHKGIERESFDNPLKPISL